MCYHFLLASLRQVSFYLDYWPISCIASADKTIGIWKDGKRIHSLQGHTDVVRNLACLDDDKIYSCSNDGYVSLFSIATFATVSYECGT